MNFSSLVPPGSGDGGPARVPHEQQRGSARRDHRAPQLAHRGRCGQGRHRQGAVRQGLRQNRREDQCAALPEQTQCVSRYIYYIACESSRRAMRCFVKIGMMCIIYYNCH